MRFIVAAAAAGLAAVAQAHSNATYVTEVVTQLTTYCPAATQITHNGQTYTVTEATTLTITNCPCTVTKPVYSSVVTSCSTCAPATSAAPSAPVYSSPAASSPVAPVYTSSAPAAPVYPAPSSSAPVVAPYPSSNGTTPAGPVGTAPGSSGSPSASAPASYTGAANKVSYGAAGMLAALGLVAAL